MPSPLLEVSGLTVARETTVILRDLHWRVRRGEHWALLGANGSGKTSLLKVLVGYLTPSAGAITVLGRRYGETDWRELRRHVGIVTSALQSSIPPEETALETAVSGARAQLDLWGRPTRAERTAARRWLGFLGVGRLAPRPWAVLSQGERQRVLIARALIARPKLLILDEPCAGLDPVAREDFLRFIDRLARRRAAPALLFVTHHVEEIVPAFTHALALRRGEIFAAGPKSSVLTARILGGAFGAPFRLQRRGGRYRASLRGAGPPRR